MGRQRAGYPRTHLWGSWDNLTSEGNREALFKLFNEYDIKVKDPNYIEIESPDEPLPDEFFEKFEELVARTFYGVTQVEAELK